MSKVQYEEFVRTWQTADSLDDVCAAFDIKRAAASGRATYLRKKGVKLKKLYRGQRLDADALNKICEELS